VDIARPWVIVECDGAAGGKALITEEGWIASTTDRLLITVCSLFGSKSFATSYLSQQKRVLPFECIRSRKDIGPLRAPRSEGQRFRDIVPTVIHIDTPLIMEKLNLRKSILYRPSKTFHLHPIAQRLQSRAYRPYEHVPFDAADKNRLLFHGTRKSCLQRFQLEGVLPRWAPNEMCSGRAFYVTNSIEQAVAHVLFVCSKRFKPASVFMDPSPVISIRSASFTSQIRPRETELRSRMWILRGYRW
jgi:hypothetical protein